MLWFQFTHPGRGATKTACDELHGEFRFNSRTPGGVRLAEDQGLGTQDGSFNSRTPGGVRHE